MAATHCALATAHEVTYLTVPVTGGPLFVEWHRNAGRHICNKDDYKARHTIEVVEPNVYSSWKQSNIVGKLWPRSTVVNPAPLKMVAWNQGDYLQLWIAFVCTRASRVALADGWNLSTGGILEVTAAFLLDIPVHAPTTTERLARLDVVRALEYSIKQLETAGLPTETFAAAIQLL